MNHLTDAELIALSKRDEVAFETLMQRHGPKAAALARSLVGDSQVDDVLQEVFISVHRGLKNFRGEAEFGTWLHRITLNACYAKLKRVVPEALEDYEHHLSSDQNVHKNAERAQLRSLIESGMQTLPLEQREAFALREFSGLEYESIAEILRCQLGTVKSRISRAKASLKEFLTSKGVRP